MIRCRVQDREILLSDFVPDLTPLIDVMFILIVFLVLTANAVPYAFELALPEDKEKTITPLEETDSLVIVLPTKKTGWVFDAKTYLDFTSLKQAVISIRNQVQHKHKRVVIVGEKHAPIETLLQLMTFLHSQQIHVADIVMEKK